MHNILYHYCALNTFTEIIKNSTIRASDCSKTNDSEETSWIATLIKDTLFEQILANEKFCSIYSFSEKKRAQISEVLSAVIYSTFYQNSRQMTTFVSCFSEKGDLLSQWRGYADDAQGISIGCNKMILQSFDTGGYNYHFKKVIYNTHEQKEYIQNHLGELMTSYENISSNESKEEAFESFLQDLALRVLTIRNDSPIFKNQAFQEEKEWRLFVNNYLANYYCYVHDNNETFSGDFDENYNKKCDYSNGFTRAPTQFRTTNNKLIPYFDLNFSKIKQKLIREIIIGPKCEASIFDIQLFLASQGYEYAKIKIRKSNATYR